MFTVSQDTLSNKAQWTGGDRQSLQYIRLTFPPLLCRDLWFIFQSNLFTLTQIK